MDDDRHEASPAGARVNTIVLAFTVVAGMIVSLRLFVRLILTKASGIEDIWIVLAMGFSIGFAATVSGQVTHGLGKHISQLDADEAATLRRSFWAGLWIHSLALTTTKVSILVQYLRIFPVRRFRTCCYCLLGTVLAYGSWAVASNIFICNPVEFSWNMSVEGFCLNHSLIWYTNASVNITLDFVIFLLPIPLIRRLRISGSQKRGLIIMIGLCASASLVSAIRFYTIGDIARSNDISYDNPAHATISAVEVNAGIICACLPAMRPLLALMMPKYFSDIPDWCDVGIAPDVEQTFPHKHEPLPFRVHQDQIIPTNPGSTLPQVPRPALSRTPSGRFAVIHNQPRTASPATTRAKPSSSSHSRSGSNISIDIAAADARANGSRFQGRTNPLRLSPLTPIAPLNSRILFPPNYAESYHTLSRQASGTNSPVFWRPGTPVLVKPLPLTPLPCGGGR